MMSGCAFIARGQNPNPNPNGNRVEGRGWDGVEGGDVASRRRVMV